MGRTLVRTFGTSAKYRQMSVESDIQVDIDSVFQVVDEETGAGAMVHVASLVKADFPFEKPRDGDTIIVGEGTAAVRWKVIKRLEDEGGMLMLEVGK